MSTRFDPLTSATTASMPCSVGATNTRLFTIWPSSASTARAASAAVWVDSLKVMISQRDPLPLGRLQHALMGRMGRVGHGPESTIDVAALDCVAIEEWDRGAPVWR